MNNKDFKKLMQKIRKTSTISKNESQQLTNKQKKYLFKNFNFILTL